VHSAPGQPQGRQLRGWCASHTRRATEAAGSCSGLPPAPRSLSLACSAPVAASLATCRSNPSEPARVRSRSTSRTVDFAQERRPRTVDFAQERRPPHLPGSMLLRQGLRPSSTTDDAPERIRSSTGYSDRLLAAPGQALGDRDRARDEQPRRVSAHVARSGLAGESTPSASPRVSRRVLTHTTRHTLAFRASLSSPFNRGRGISGRVDRGMLQSPFPVPFRRPTVPRLQGPKTDPV